jgi:hypothetical protein
VWRHIAKLCAPLYFSWEGHQLNWRHHEKTEPLTRSLILNFLYFSEEAGDSANVSRRTFLNSELAAL